MSHNSLTLVPPAIYKLVTLERLNLADNDIKRLDDEDTGLWVNMRRLTLSRNDLRALPVSFCFLSLSLFCSSRRHLLFSFFQESMGKMEKLEALYANSNDLGALPESLEQCTRMVRQTLVFGDSLR